MTKRKTVAEGWVPNQHGIISSYVRGCRCTECRAANAERQRRNQASRRLDRRKKAERVEINGVLVHPDPYGRHGTVTAYTTCGCRCDACRESESERRYALRHPTLVEEKVEVDLASVFSF